jgi:hypothetical protein
MRTFRLPIGANGCARHRTISIPSYRGVGRDLGSPNERLPGSVRDLLLLLLPIDELVPILVAGIKPLHQGRRLPGTRFCQGDYRIWGRLHPYGRDGLKPGVEHAVIRIEDLDDVPIVRRIRQLEDVGSSRQYLPRNLHRGTEGNGGLLIDHLGVRAGVEEQTKGNHQSDNDVGVMSSHR